MHESRLFKILYHLLQNGRASAPQLAQELEVSVRTIYRDIDALSSAGIPVFTENGRNGGIYLMEDFTLDRTLLSEQEKQEILTALQGVQAAPGTDHALILQKLSALFQTPADDWLEVDFARWGSHPTDNTKFETLKTAIMERKCLKITYTASSMHSTERIIYPLKLFYKGQAWYLKSYCTLKQDFRLFKLNRILSLEPLEESFRCGPFPQTVEDSPFEQEVTLSFPCEMAYRVYDEFDPEQVAIQEDGTLFVRAKLPDDNWLIGFLLSFGPNVTVLTPAHLKDDLAEQARRIYEKNKSFDKP